MQSSTPRPPLLHDPLEIVPHKPPLHRLWRPPIRALLAGEDVDRGERVPAPVFDGVTCCHHPAITRHAPRLNHVRVPLLPAPEAIEPVDQLRRADDDVSPLDFITKLVDDPGANLGGHLPAEG